MKQLQVYFVASVLFLFTLIFASLVLLSLRSNNQDLLSMTILILSVIFIAQGLFTLQWMLFAWNNQKDTKKFKAPDKYEKPFVPFTVLLPARHEEHVIEDTINSFTKVNYPEDLLEVLVIIRNDDEKTLQKAKQAIAATGKKWIKLITFSDTPITKPHSLNIGLQYASHPFLTIFDAEDEPHPDIFNAVNTVILNEKVEVIQSGVCLMNAESSWYATLNVLEYYFWFKSGLPYFTHKAKATPLGGNTVFFKTIWLRAIGGWDENCLTEDAYIGIKLSSKGAKIKVIYDESLVTKEEAPSTIADFLRQRTRWNQGFLQVYAKGDWTKLPTFKKKAFISYILLSPIIQSVLFLYLPLSLYLAIMPNSSILFALISAVPGYLLLFQIVVNLCGLYFFSKVFKKHIKISTYLKVIVFFYPYQILLSYAAARAVYRILFKNISWEKTTHLNIHRAATALESLPVNSRAL